MSVCYDFTIVSNTPINGIALVQPLNEQAYNYIVDELEYSTLSDGSCPLFASRVGDFISDAESAHLCTSYI